jgi:predicted small lipoprotein YifL
MVVSLEGHRAIRRAVGLFAIALALASCGAKTGLLIPDASQLPDGGMDAGRDAGPDASDAQICRPDPVALERRGAQILFVVDRSNSMRASIEGEENAPVGRRRWDVLALALEAVLRDADPLLEIGAKFYPRWSETPATTPEEACSTARGIDLAPARRNVVPLLTLFRDTGPFGGTPTAVGLGEVRDYFRRTPAPDVPRFVVLATDGGPNCNPDTGVPANVCVCTGIPSFCTGDPEFGPYNCLDEARTLAATRSLFEELGVPVYVIGIDDPTRPDLADVLDRIAIAGGRPRGVPGERQFYSVRRTDDLRGALGTITDSISRCVFTVEPAPSEDDVVEVRLEGSTVPRDPSRTEGWDFTRPDRSELSLFGDACDRVQAGDDDVVAEITCPEE